MINWDLTLKDFGYTYDILSHAKRPIVICQCDQCSKTRPIKVRIKSKIIDHQMSWLCPSCVKLKDSSKISKRMSLLWQDKHYRKHQLEIKSDANYKTKQSTAGKSRWLDINYRSKIEKNIQPTEYINRSISRHGDNFDYTESEFRKWHDKIIVTCKYCSRPALKDPQKHLIHGYCQGCGISKGHREISQYINEIGHITTINDRSTLSGLELDLFIESHAVAVEYHGLYWHSFGHKESRTDITRHQLKALRCNEANIKLFQFFDFEWSDKTQIVKSMISNALGISTKVDARKMQIKLIDNKEAEKFFNANHLYGHRPAKITVALLDHGDIFAAMSFSKNNSGYEIIRLAYKCGYSIRGGASRLFKYAIHNISREITTFADLRYSTGNVYEKLGFKKIKITAPGYFYYKQTTNDYIILSRQQCQKNKLNNLLSFYDPALSESQNMFNNNYRRVWNAGNILYKHH